MGVWAAHIGHAVPRGGYVMAEALQAFSSTWIAANNVAAVCGICSGIRCACRLAG